MNPRALFFGFSFRHHGQHSAFSALAAALADQEVVDVSPPWPSWTPHALEWRLNWRWMYYAEYRIRPWYRRADRQVIHYFFPENTMFRAHEWKGRHALVATCHQPADRISKPRPNDPKFARFLAGVRASDAVVVQSDSLIESYRALFPSVRLVSIPHGVDTGFFRPADAAARAGHRPRILTIGNWLRDYRTWAGTVRILQARGCDADFVVIANPGIRREAREALGSDHPRVHYLGGLSDEALRDEYRKADVLLLTLKDAMANNALLEGLATGTPLVVTDLPATRDYAGDAAVYVPPADAEAAAEAVARVLDDAAHARGLRRAARTRAENALSWTVVANQYRALYEDVRNP